MVPVCGRAAALASDRMIGFELTVTDNDSKVLVLRYAGESTLNMLSSGRKVNQQLGLSVKDERLKCHYMLLSHTLNMEKVKFLLFFLCKNLMRALR